MHEIKEIAAKYDVRELEKGPVVIEQDDDAVIVAMAKAEYRAWQEWLAGERMIEEALRPLQPDIEAYERMLPELLHTHLGQWVALRDRRIVDVDADYAALSQRMEQCYQHPYLIMQVEPLEPYDEISSPEELDERVSV